MTAPIFDQARKRGTHDRVGQLNPMGRYGVAEGAPFLLYLFEIKSYLYPSYTEIANATLFLASGALAFFTFNVGLMVSGRRLELCERSSLCH